MRALLKRQKISQAWQWIFVPCAAVVGFVVGLETFLLLLFLPFPRPLAEPTGNFVAGFLVVFASIILAPSHRLATGIAAFALGTLAHYFCFEQHLISACLGSVFALGLVIWWYHPHRTSHSIIWVGRAVAAMLIGYLGIVYAFHKDWFARSSELPIQVTNALGTDAARVATFYNYDLGGFMNRDYLWRIDAKPEVIAQIITGLALQKTNTVPEKFWRLPPYYWPRSMPAGGEAFQSRSFSVDQSGDGDHYFLLYDKAQERAFLWVKENM